MRWIPPSGQGGRIVAQLPVSKECDGEQKRCLQGVQARKARSFERWHGSRRSSGSRPDARCALVSKIVGAWHCLAILS